MSQYGVDQYGIDQHGRSRQPRMSALYVTATPMDKVTLRVTFSEPMRWTNPSGFDDISNIANYDIANGGGSLTIKHLILRAANEVDLVFYEMNSGLTYTLTVDDNVTTLAGRPFYEELSANPVANQDDFLGIEDLPPVELYINDAYGKGRYHYMAYGRDLYPYDPFAPTKVVSAEALDVRTIRVTYAQPMRRTSTIGYDDVTNPANYLIQSGVSVVTVTGVNIRSEKIFDLAVRGMLNGAQYLMTVDEHVETEAGRPFLQEIPYNPFANKARLTGLSLVPQIVLITNPADGFLKVVFNKAMELESEIQRPSNYQMSPAERKGDEAETLRIVIVEETPNELLLQFEGGGSGAYYLTVTGGIVDLYGNELHPGPYAFDITRPGIDELFVENHYFIDTVLGAIRFTVNKLSSRRIDDLAILRTMDRGYERQFQNIYEALKRHGINRDDTRLKIFKG